jgi:hypothetical protein
MPPELGTDFPREILNHRKRPVLAALWGLQDYLRGGPYERS